jgi:hypothetical protein
MTQRPAGELVDFDALWAAWLLEARREHLPAGEPLDLQQAAAATFEGLPGGPYPAELITGILDRAIAGAWGRQPRYRVVLGQLVADPRATGSTAALDWFAAETELAHARAIVAESRVLGVDRAARRFGLSPSTVKRLRRGSDGPRGQNPTKLVPARRDSGPNPLRRPPGPRMVEGAGPTSCSGPAKRRHPGHRGVAKDGDAA